MKTMTQNLQLKFQCDADQDNGHSQTSYIGYLAESVICWCSTDQGSVSTSTAESEIKAVNHTLKAEVISNRGIIVGCWIHPIAFIIPRLEMTSALSVWLTALISDSAVDVETLPWSVEHQQITDSPKYPM